MPFIVGNAVEDFPEGFFRSKIDCATVPVAQAEELRKLMRPSPWEEGWAYCAAYCEGVVAAARVAPQSLRRISTGSTSTPWR